MEKPEKNLPRAIPLAIGIITLIYFRIVFVSMYIDPIAMVTSKEPIVLASIFKNQILQKIMPQATTTARPWPKTTVEPM